MSGRVDRLSSRVTAALAERDDFMWQFLADRLEREKLEHELEESRKDRKQLAKLMEDLQADLDAARIALRQAQDMASDLRKTFTGCDNASEGDYRDPGPEDKPKGCDFCAEFLDNHACPGECDCPKCQGCCECEVA